MDNSTEKGFSLIELLAAMAVVAILTGLLVPALANLGKASSLSTAGSKVNGLVSLAGQNSAARNAMTALVAVLPDSGRTDYAFTLLELAPDSGGWKQIHGWEKLPSGIAMDQCSFVDYPVKNPEPAFPKIQYNGKEITSFKYVIFLPNKSLRDNGSAQLRLVEGFFEGNTNSVVYTRRDATGNPDNYFTMTVLGATGRTKIDRP